MDAVLARLFLVVCIGKKDTQKPKLSKGAVYSSNRKIPDTNEIRADNQRGQQTQFITSVPTVGLV